jgi:uncharacterized SAM-binding protein YcdF (DUF218 family)
MKNDTAETIDSLAKRLWDYHHLNQELETADCILVLGGNDIRVAKYGAHLFLSNWAPLMIFSGGRGRLTSKWEKPEADVFAQIAVAEGVPRNKIFVENQSTNTGENILFTKKLVEERGLHLEKLIVVIKPHKERRTYAAFKKQWSEKRIIVTSPRISFEGYPNEYISKGDLITSMVGELERIQKYPQLGFQIPQAIDTDILEAYHKLVTHGFKEHLAKKRFTFGEK